MTLRTLQTGPISWTGQAAISTGAQLTPKPRRFFVMHWRSEKRCSAPSIPIRREPQQPRLLLQAQGDFAGARPLFERALAIREKVLGPEHPDTATSLSNLAILLQDQGDFAGARPLFERALAIREKALGPEHPNTARSLNNLARLLQDQGDFAGARPLFERALAIREKVLGPEHPDTATSLNNLACCSRTRATLQGRGRSTSAHWRYAKRRSAPSIPIRRRASTTSPLLQDQGDLAGGAALFERALAIREKALGPEHPDTATASTTSPSCSRPRATLQGRGRSTSAHWRYAKRRSAPSIPIRRRASTTSPCCSSTRATLRGRGRSTSARWRSAGRRSAPSIQIPIARAPICLACSS